MRGWLLQALKSENANSNLVLEELECACGNLPRETSMIEAASSCSAPVRQVLFPLPPSRISCSVSIKLGYICLHESWHFLLDGKFCITTGFYVDAIASCVQFAAVLHQLDVRVKDLNPWGNHWLTAALGTSFVKVGKTNP